MRLWRRGRARAEERDAIAAEIETLPEDVQRKFVAVLETLRSGLMDTMDCELALDELSEALEPWPVVHARVFAYLRPSIERRLR